jgi:hypothetical protein
MRAVALLFGHGTVVAGVGTCPNGPAHFTVVRISPLPFTRWLLRDLTR